VADPPPDRSSAHPRDVALLPHPSFGRRGAPLDPMPRPFRPCDEASLAAAVDATAEWLAGKQQPVIVVGRQARCAATGGAARTQNA
jgi:thiamine pyrophosphate-dependent acetolactate synthase large subunit-like protein